MAKRKFIAMISTTAVEVGCPHCGEPQPDPSAGSHNWTSEEFAAANDQQRECVSCDKSFVIIHVRKVTLV